MTMEEGRRKDYNDFSLRMSSSFFKRWMCCVVENLSRVFLSKQPFLLLWLIRVYIVWMKGKKVTFKILQAECFAGTSQDGLSHKALAKCSMAIDFLASSMCFSRAIFAGYSSHEIFASQSRNCIDSSFHAQFFINLILNQIQ